MKIFFDFDDVLFHTQAFVDETRKVFEQQGVSEGLYRETYAAARRLGNDFLKVYSLDIHLETLADIVPGFNGDEVRRGVGQVLSDTRPYLFPDVEACLRELARRGADIFVASFGKPDFQRAKIANSGIGEFLKDILADLEMKSTMMGRVLDGKTSHEEVWFFDDQVKFLEDVKRAFPFVRTVQVCREEGRFNCDRSPVSEFLVRDMDGAMGLLSGLNYPERKGVSGEEKGPLTALCD
jgi:hypothetical protein